MERELLCDNCDELFKSDNRKLVKDEEEGRPIFCSENCREEFDIDDDDDDDDEEFDDED